MIKEILYPAISLGGLGLIFGIILGAASKKFKIEVDERVPLVREKLPGANCGGCGFAGCDAYAEAIVSGKAPANLCNIGGEKAAKAIGEVLGVEVKAADPVVAFVKCQGTCVKSKSKYDYHGLKSCHDALTLADVGPKACEYGCTGFGDCVKQCQFNAISVVDGIAVVDNELCTGCGSCAAACPKGIIELVPKKQSVKVACSSKDKGMDVKKVCTSGCIGCGICAKNCPNQAITVEDNIAHIDYSKCTNCGICVSKCPVKAIINK